MYINTRLQTVLTDITTKLKDSGRISDIDNDDLKVALTNYYERGNNQLIASNEFAEQFTNNRVVPYIINHLNLIKTLK